MPSAIRLPYNGMEWNGGSGREWNGMEWNGDTLDPVRYAGKQDRQRY